MDGHPELPHEGAHRRARADPRDQFVFCSREHRLTPRPACETSITIDLAPLLLFGEQIAFETRGEPALRAERELLERHVLRGRVDPAAQLVDRFELPGLGRDQAQDDDLPLRDETQRLKPPERSSSYSSRRRWWASEPKRRSATAS